MINPSSRNITIFTLIQLAAISATILFTGLAEGVDNVVGGGYYPGIVPLISEYGFCLIILPLAWMISILYLANRTNCSKTITLLYILGLVFTLFFGYLFVRSLGCSLSR